MGYSIRPAAVEQVRVYLKEMTLTNEEIVWLSKDPNKFRYVLHQGMKAAKVLVAEYPQYRLFAELEDKFQIKTDGNKVIARPKKHVNAAVVKDERVTEQRMVFDNVQSRTDVIGVLAQHNNATELVFKDLSLTNDDLHNLFLVTQKYDYHMLPNSTGLTLSKKDEDADIAWTPETG